MRGRDGEPSRAILMHSYAWTAIRMTSFSSATDPDVMLLDKIYARLRPEYSSGDGSAKQSRIPGDVFEKALEKLAHGGAIVNATDDVSRG